MPPVVTAFVEVLSPMTETALPPMVTGSEIGATSWLPPSRLSVPSVVTSPPWPEPGCTEPPWPEPPGPPVVVASEVWLSPITETAFPPTMTGSEIGAMS